MACRVRHFYGSWNDVDSEMDVVRATGRNGGDRVTIELVTQRRALYPCKPGLYVHACCVDQRTVIRLAGDVSSSRVATAVREAFRRFAPKTSTAKRRHIG